MFISLYEYIWQRAWVKNIETEAVFTKTEFNNEWNVNFIQKIALCI